MTKTNDWQAKTITDPPGEYQELQLGPWFCQVYPPTNKDHWEAWVLWPDESTLAHTKHDTEEAAKFACLTLLFEQLSTWAIDTLQAITTEQRQLYLTVQAGE